nr:hypothetical protein CFP56_40390 [Quercus suber]
MRGLAAWVSPWVREEAKGGWDLDNAGMGEAIENNCGFRRDLFFSMALSGSEEKVDERNVGQLAQPPTSISVAATTDHLFDATVSSLFI